MYCCYLVLNSLQNIFRLPLLLLRNDIGWLKNIYHMYISKLSNMSNIKSIKWKPKTKIPHCLNSSKIPHCLNSSKIPHCLNSSKIPHCLNSSKIPHCLNSSKIQSKNAGTSIKSGGVQLVLWAKTNYYAKQKISWWQYSQRGYKTWRDHTGQLRNDRTCYSI